MSETFKTKRLKELRQKASEFEKSLKIQRDLIESRIRLIKEEELRNLNERFFKPKKVKYRNFNKK